MTAHVLKSQVIREDTTMLKRIVLSSVTIALLAVATPAHADPVENTNPELSVLSVERLAGKAVRVTLSDGLSAKINPCKYEDGRRCYWNAGQVGNRVGSSFIVVRGVRFFVDLDSKSNLI